MTPDEALALPSGRLDDYIARCWDAIEVVAPFASDGLLDALQAEADCIESTVAVRALPAAHGR